jgi:hypothetical protein
VVNLYRGRDRNIGYYGKERCFMNKIVKTVVKKIVKFAPAILTGILTVKSELENQTLRNTVKDLGERVSILEKK